jgi:NAD(P)-dependent dehydrogenase (short-subunit alcohol dehydrogenase family)
MVGRVQDKVAIVTGAASGIGRATAELLAREGASVGVADLNGAGAKEVADGIGAAGGRAIAIEVDIKSEESVAAMVAATVDVYGALHVLFNNAADTSLHMMLHDGPIHTMSVETWDHALAVDLRGTMLGCKHAIPHMLAAGSGSIINTSSNQGISGDMSQSAYAAAKAGVNQLTMTVATTYGRQGIRCNAVSPGMIRTPAAERACPPEMFDEIQKHSLVPRIGVPEDLAFTVLFLASDESAYITGHVIKVDGGQLAHLPHYAFLTASGQATTHQAK